MNQILSKTPIRKQAGMFLAIGLALICLLGVLSMPAASAAGTEEVTLTVRQSLVANVGEVPNQTFTYRLVPLSASNPMPVGSGADGFIFTATGTGETQVGPIQFTSVGIFSYQLRVIQSSTPRYTYDTRIYYIDVYILNDTPDNLSISNLTSIVIVRNEDDDKVDEILFEHRYDAEMITIAGIKTWEHGNNPFSSRPESITVHVMDGERVVASAVITEADHWMWTFIVPRNRADGSEIVYTLREDPVYGYETIVTGFDITNRHESVSKHPGYILLEGQKTWEHGNNPVNSRPQSITVLIKNGSAVVERVTITADDGWRWVAFVPRYDVDGNPIHYTISEENVPRYTLTVNGLNLHNRFVSANFPGDNPHTGDDRNILFWSVLTAVSFIGLIVIVFRKKKTKATT
ncbi:MAG: Cna B-type domain-containing protein [Oscillospiraceae bacterium]|nr:Cna B-type domain-containing protein [Oscillospiraceae bacterium]